MDWILDQLAIGSWNDAADDNILRNESVAAILNVRADDNDPTKKKMNEKEKKYCLANNIEYCYLPVKDYTVASDDQLVRGVAFIERNVSLGRRVLIHCDAGLGRSPSFAATYLILKGYSAEEAVELIKNKRFGCFKGRNSIHIPKIKKFQVELADKLARTNHS